MQQIKEAAVNAALSGGVVDISAATLCRLRAAAMPPAMLVGRVELRERYGIPYSREHLWRLEKAGLFPKSIKLTVNRCAWVASEIEAWIAAKMAAR